jgi:hypothetical protein
VGIYNQVVVADIQEVWKVVLPELRKAVTGVGVWAALNSCRPLLVEDDILVIGLPHESSELGGHLRLAHTKHLIETMVSEKYGSKLTLRVIDGTAMTDWETVKRRDIEARRLQDQALEKARLEMAARSTWDSVYEQLGRTYAAISNKSLPQNRARFFREAVALVVEARKANLAKDELGERNFARCIERVAQYSDVPSTVVAMHILGETGEG